MRCIPVTPSHSMQHRLHTLKVCCGPICGRVGQAHLTSGNLSGHGDSLSSRRLGRSAQQLHTGRSRHLPT